MLGYYNPLKVGSVSAGFAGKCLFNGGGGARLMQGRCDYTVWGL